MDRVKKYLEAHNLMFHIFWVMIVTAVSLTAYAFTNFPIKADIEKRLDRIEGKLDHLIDHQLPRRGK